MKKSEPIGKLSLDNGDRRSGYVGGKNDVSAES